MGSFAFTAALVSLLATTTGKRPTDNGIYVHKCCEEYEMLAGDGRTCVSADWPRNVSFQSDQFEHLVRPLDETWVRKWLPPGLPHEKIQAVWVGYKHIPLHFSASVRVNSSRVWGAEPSLQEDVWRSTVVFWGKMHAARPRPGGGVRRAHYCVDAALPPLGPFAMLLGTKCSHTECATKCCGNGQVMVNQKGSWKCEVDGRGFWTPFNSSFSKAIDSEFPFAIYLECDTSFRLADPEDRYAPWARSMLRHLLFATWQPCFDQQRNSSTLEEGLFYCASPRVARGIYWVLQPLCFVSTLLLATALLSIACDTSMRRKVHGWCLACHALCLFGFNVGQIVYYVALSDLIDATVFDNIPVYLENICTPLALSMYFLLMAAWCWLMALCVNMALGFRLQAAAPSRSGRRNFLIFSVTAWGLPTALTITCSNRFIQSYKLYSSKSSWSYPSLVETRVCYNEPFGNVPDGSSIASHKWGTTLFYYGPVGCLMVCNIACLAITLRKVQRLRRGNSVLRREEDRRRHVPGNPPSTGSVTRADGGRSLAADARTIKMYLKMLLMTGAIELGFEVILWLTSNNSNEVGFESRDYHFPYRTSGYIIDFLRAVCVTWLAAPESGYVGLILRRWKAGKK